MKLENLAENNMSSKIIYLDEIDSKNLFYEEITTLAYSQFGINELLSRGFYNYRELNSQMKKILSKKYNHITFPMM
jgi:hypothetical protein